NAGAGIGWRSLFVSSARAFWLVAVAATVAVTVAVAVPGARRLLHFGVPSLGDLVLCIALVVVSIAIGAALSMRAGRPAAIASWRAQTP
ncbi:MAG TPA: hypothetical protein VIO33_23600, partial [Burkholderiaceae bacterium]